MPNVVAGGFMEKFIIGLSQEEEGLCNIIEPLLDSEGFELVRLCLKRAQAKANLAIFIDTKGKKNGVILDNLEFVSRLLGDVLDAMAEDAPVLNARYDLEVSSPGLDRPLSKLSHFQDAKDSRIKVVVNVPDKYGAKNLMGPLLEVNDDAVVVGLEQRKNEPTSIPFSDMVLAHVIFDFSKMSNQKKKLN